MRHKVRSLALLVVLLLALSCVLPVAAAPDRGNIIHVVKPGETLYSIARLYGVAPAAIARANGITNPNLIYVGQRLVIPVSQPTGGGRVHIVRAGETLFRIAARYGVDVWAIARLNGITNLNRIYVGQRLIIPGAAPTPQPTEQPATWPGPWTGEYFDNASLQGAPYVTRSDPSINFNWSTGPAAGGMPVNYFSVRWNGTFGFEEGTYRFFAKVDDGVRVFVDDVLVIDGWREGALRTYQADRALSAGNHRIRVEYFEATGAAEVYVWYRKIAGPTPTPTPTVAPIPTDVWLATYYNNKNLSGTPVVTRYDTCINFDWKGESPDPGVWWDGFSARWVRRIYLRQDHYRFCTMSDDGSRVWVNDQLVLDEWHANNGVTYCGVYYATTGWHTVRVEYYEDGGKALMYMWWEPH